MSVGFAEELGDEAKHAIAEQKGRPHLPRGAGLAGVKPQQDEQQQPFHQELIDL